MAKARTKKEKKKKTKTKKNDITLQIIAIIAFIVIIIALVYLFIVRPGFYKGKAPSQAEVVLRFNYHNKEIEVTKPMIDKEFAIFTTLSKLSNPLMTVNYSDAQKINITKVEMLFLFYAKDYGIDVSEEELNSFIDNISASINMEDLYNELLTYGVTEKDFKNYIRIKMIIRKVITDLVNKINITDQEIEKFYNENKEMFIMPETREIRQIVVNSSELADIILKKLERGEDFSTLAKEYSIGPFASRGGYVGNVTRQALPKNLGDIIFNLGIGNYSGVITTQYGNIIVQVIGKSEERPISLKEAEPFIRQMIAQTKFQEVLGQIMKELEKEYLIK